MKTYITHIGQKFLHNGGAEIFLRDISKLFENKNFEIRQSICTQEKFYEKEFCETFPHPVIIGGQEEIANAINMGDVILIWGHLRLNEMQLPKPEICIFNACAEAKEQLEGCSNYVTHIIACSTKTASVMCENYAHTIILPGIETKKLVVTKNRDFLRTSLGIKKTDFLVGMIARIEKAKQQHWLVETMKHVDENIKAIFVGDGPFLEELKQNSPKNCIFVGHQNDVANWWNILDCYCLLSQAEGCSAALFEAMYCKVPIISTKVGSVFDLLDDTNSVLIENQNELLNSIYKVKNNKLNLTNFAFDKFKQYGDINYTVDSWIRLIKELKCKKLYI